MEVLSSKEESIYDDLINQGDLGVVIHNLQSKNKQLQFHVASLEEDIQKLCDRITEMKQTQENLSRNISELYKTAKSEVDRKDRLISELQSKLDDMVFKRNTAPSNFGFKRHRKEEYSEAEEVVKKPKFETEMEPFQDNSACENKSRNILSDIDKKIDSNKNKNSKICDSQNMFKLRNVRDDRGRHSNSWDRTSKYDSECRRRRSKSRDRGYRRSNRDDRDYRVKDKSDNHSRENSNYERDRRDNRDRNTRGSRQESSREQRSRNEKPKNNRSDRIRKSRSEDRKDSLNNPVECEPRFSPVESTRSTPDIIQHSKEILNESKEEGEVSDVENEPKSKKLSERKSTPDSEKHGINKKKSAVEFQGSSSNKKINEFDVSKFIEKQHDRGKKKQIEASVTVKTESDSSIKTSIEQVDIEKITRYHNSEIKNDSNSKLKDKKNICISSQYSENNERKPTEKHKEREARSEVKNKSNENIEEPKEVTKNQKITILSQVVLNEVKIESMITGPPHTVKPREDSNNVNRKEEIKSHNVAKGNTSKTIPNKDKHSRECGVPRNLTGELDINLEKTKHKEKKVEKECQTKTERVQKRLSSLFDTPIKEQQEHVQEKQHLFDQKFHQTCTSEDLKLEREKKHQIPKEINLNENDISTKKTLTPVSEFQIFKTNLPSLEKSNSLSSIGIHFQTNSSCSMKNVEVSKQDNSKVDDADQKTKITIENNPKMSKESRKEGDGRSFQEIVESGQAVVENENVGYGNTIDMCNISLDLLNAHLGEYKADDYPNLTAHTETHDMPNLLLTPVNTQTHVVNKQASTSVKSLDFSKETSVIEKSPREPKLVDSKTMNVSVTSSNDLMGNGATINTSVSNTSISPSSGNGRRKRKRCVIKWAE